ncbi:MOSC domain-containing protein [uncultured Jatrophihabitans sp.]|uniref:MOSC domain-containing protein n=1 Tax=uncultured Jatrophihabitans sp. TaxID=1610747 RepID=UPI0035CB0CB0
MALTLDEINRFPVKSLRGQALTESIVEPWGLAGDRRWLVVDADGALITAREYPRMLLVTPTLRADGGLEFAGPDAAPLHVAPADGPLVDVRVWKSELQATLADDHGWFGDLLGVPARLVYLDDPTRRHPNPRFARPDDYVSFADGYPLLLTTTASLDALNDLILEGPRSDEGPLPMVRFRPSVVVRGSEPWAEDGWRSVRIGDAVFRAVKGCDRCVMTTTDADTAARGKEPIATLARHRRWDGATWFGMSLVPDSPGATIRVGDEVEVLYAEPAPDGPPR